MRQKETTCLQRLSRVNVRVAEFSTSMPQLMKLCTIRKFYMISELAEIFPIEVAGAHPRRANTNASGYVSRPKNLSESLIIMVSVPSI